MRRRYTLAIILMSVAGVLLLAAMLLVAVPYMSAKSGMPEDMDFTLTMEEDGGAVLSWDKVAGVDGYSVSITRVSDGARLYNGRTAVNNCRVPQLPEEELTLTVGSIKYLTVFGRQLSREGDTDAVVTFRMRNPDARNLTANVDPAEGAVTLFWDGVQGDTYSVCLRDEWEKLTVLQETDGGEVTLHLGEWDLRVPDYGSGLTFVVDGRFEQERMSILGSGTVAVSVRREDFLEVDLSLSAADLGHNRYTLSWSEVPAEGYALELSTDGGEWETVGEYGQGDALVYDTGKLQSFSDYAFRVTARGGSLPNGVLVSNEFSVTATATPLYATVWTVCALDIYAAPDRADVIGTTTEGAYCVLDETDGMFYVRFPDGYGYIDSEYCLINLPDYLGDLVSYDIANSYSSLYTVHGYAIDHVTGTVVNGYGNVVLSSGEFLAPMLYPTARKLVTAALSARADGYRLKVVDAFRPLSATYDLFDWTSEILDDPVPDWTYSGAVQEEMPDVPLLSELQGDLPEDEESAEESYEGQYLTYGLLMGDSLDSFLASDVSYHNIGAALDVTLERNGMELKAQTSIHDLSAYSAVTRNNESSDRLMGYMESAGFIAMPSEWWHFVDVGSWDEVSASLRVNGVTPEGWVADENGFRYRLRSGGFCVNRRVTIDGVTYKFDADGYVRE